MFPKKILGSIMLKLTNDHVLVRRISRSSRLVIGFLSGLLTWSSWACTCYGASLENAYGVSDAVIEAKVIPGSMTGEERRVYVESRKREETYIENRAVSLRVSKVWKGEDVDTVEMYDPSNSNCGFSFDENQTYIVFADFRFPQEIASDEELIDSDRKIRPMSTTILTAPPSESQDSPQENSNPDTEPQGRPLFTHYCMENVEVPQNRSSQQIKAKLDRLQKEASNTPETSKYTESVRRRIGEIVKSTEGLNRLY